MNTAHRVGAALVGLVAVATLAACGTDTPRAQTPTVTSTVTASSSTTTAQTGANTGATDVDVDTPSEPTRSGDGGDPAPAATTTQTCGPVGGNSVMIDAAIAKIAPPLPGEKWAPERANFDSCNQLSWVDLGTAGGTGSSPDQLLLFGPDSRFLGTGIKCGVAFQEVTGFGRDHVDVTYRYLRNENESNAGASGRAYVTFRWNGSRVVMEGTLPYEVTRGQC